MQKPDIQELTDFLITYARTMLSSGTYTARVSKCASRIAKSYGYELNFNFFFHHFTLNIVDSASRANSRTYVVPNISAHLNFKLILDLSALSWAIYDGKFELNRAKDLFNQICAQKKYPFIFNLFLVSIGNAAFCRLFEGDLGSVCVIFFSTFFGLILRQILGIFKIDLRVQYIICAFFSSFFVYIGISAGFVREVDIAFGSSILYLIPGVFFINSIIDILKDHILMGLSRAISVLLLVSCIAIGLYMTLGISNLELLK